MPEVRVLRAGFSDMEFGLAFRPLCCFLTAVVRSHGLSVYMILTVAMVTALLPLASALDPCLKPEEVNENWRSTDEPPQDSNHRCDRGRFAPTKWYLFNIDGSNATIPTHCIKNKYCGTNIAMRIEMSGEPDEGQVVEAFLCGSYDVLGQYDCCVLRTPVRVSSCGGRLVYQFYHDFDRCAVAVCAQKEPVPPKVIAQMGEPYTDSLLTHNVTDGETTTPDPSSSPPTSETATSDAAQTTDRVKGEDTATSVSSTEVTGVTSSTELAKETSAATTETSASTTETSASTTETSASTTETSASITETSAGTSETSAYTMEISTSTTETSASTSSTDETDTEPTSQDVPPSQPTSESSSTSEEPSETATTVKKDTQCSDTSCQTDSIDTTTQEAKSDSTINPFAPQAFMSSTGSSSTEEDGDSNSTLDFTSTLDPSTTATADTTTTLTVSTAAISDSSTEADDQNSTSSVPEYPPAAEPTKKDDIPEPPTDDVTTPVETTEESTTSHLSSPMTPPPHSDATTSDTSVMTSPVIRDTDISADTTSATASTTSSSTPTSISSSSSPPSSSSSTTSTPAPSSSSPPPITTSTEALTTQSTTTREPRDDVTITENMRLVFDGNYTNLLQAFSGHLVSYVYRILNNFLSRITYEAQPRWRFNISDAPLPSMGYHQDKTYVDVTITHNSGKFSREIFDEHDLAKYFKDHTNLTLLTTCRTGQSCEMTSPVAQPTVFKKHAPVFIAVIILCSVCLLLIVIGLAWARFWRRGTYKAGGENVEQRVVAKDRPYYNATPSPFTDEQIMKDEVAEPSTKQPDTPMRDDEMNGNGDSTWVIPLDDAPVTYNMEDTKL